MTHLSRFSKIFWVCSVLILVSIPIVIQSQKKNADEEPVLQNYRGVQVGWLVEEVRKKLGNPTDKGEDLDLYTFGEKETAQVYYDKTTKKVTAISVDFLNGATGVFTPQQVFGSDIEAKSDGSKYKLVRYPKAGFWISYSRTAGDSPMVSITIQKMQGQ